MEKILNEDNQPFININQAVYLAELYYPEQVIISCIDEDKICNTHRSNAYQPDGQYFYYFVENK